MSALFTKSCCRLFVLLFFLMTMGCKVYTFRDVSIPPDVKTVKIGFIENRASYVNPQISPRLTDNLQQKVVQYTKLNRTNADDAHYQISGFISGYNVSTSGVTNNAAASNRLTVTVRINFRNSLTNETKEFDIQRNFDFSSNLSLQEAERQLLPQIIQNTTDEIFNRIFSNW